ncbi:ABC transporter ATP-binding protein [Streptococcus gallolyticus]|uniref:ABC transporter ATP-binding protein n=1 Tax=Streptococcus gallolyticus TaxID=315405 RepID=UPI0008916E00|nr:ABC transporter ATP-binding protein [Streptococcus gallolyticus]SDJ97789.1 putative ABC transport system ATP-binding protein [Streptococcus gallolyticus]SDL47481.1 putative ABC transport system ATP-binding protein [Streptococcus gallolyticus]
MSFIEFQNVVRQYGEGESLVTAVDHINFQIDRGEFVVILGQSGAGKSTVLNLLGGMDQPTSGKITVDGRLISEMNDQELSDYRATDIGFIFQFYNLLPMLTAYENIAITKEIVDDTLNPDEILKLVGLEHCRNKFPVHLSGGEQQRVSIARALCKNPKFLLGDEPTGALDSQTGQEVLTLIQNMCRNYGRTTILVTHNEDIARCADKVIKMKNGKIITIEKNDTPALVSEVDW